MSDFSQTVATVDSWWHGEKANQYMTGLDHLDTEIRDCQTEISGIRNQPSGFNPLKILSNAWARATQIPPIKSRQEDYQNQYDKLENALIKAAVHHADQILDAKSQDDPDIAQDLTAIKDTKASLTETHVTLKGIKTKTKDVLDVIQTAWKEADQASGWETIDMFGSNAAFSVLSHFETSDAVKHLNKVGETLKYYKTFMDTAQEKLSSLQLTPLRAEGITEIAQWDLWMGVLDIDIISFFTSWRNKEKLESAKEKLETLEKNIEPIAHKTDALLSTTSAQIDDLDRQHMAIRDGVVLKAGLPREFHTFYPAITKQEGAKPAPSLDAHIG